MLRDDFTTRSDIDLLVEYYDGITITQLDMVTHEIQLTQLIRRQVDFRTRGELSPYFRQNVLDSAWIIYERQ